MRNMRVAAPTLRSTHSMGANQRSPPAWVLLTETKTGCFQPPYYLSRRKREHKSIRTDGPMEDMLMYPMGPCACALRGHGFPIRLCRENSNLGAPLPGFRYRDQ